MLVLVVKLLFVRDTNLYYITNTSNSHMPKKIKFDVFLEEYDDISTLPADSQTLINQAIKACQSAYAVYSGFSVGAAVQLENGEIILGSNQENASFPNGICAERVALFAAAAKYPAIPVLKLAVAAMDQTSDWTDPVYPCGGCRQVMIEYQLIQKSPIEIIMYGSARMIRVAHSVDMLLPFRFSAKPMDNST
ncbi:MAG: cytidine deaminase [Cyclobacteriaceae bacterium]|nr:MAG: cytidine deaminase [Cyclobacteriaceae bacterium]